MQEAHNNLLKASIVIPAYNAESYIESTLDSIFASTTHYPFEIIVVNDGSTDRTAEVVQGFRDTRVSLLNVPNSGGPSRPRNVGISHSKGEYVFIFDSDDIMLPDKIDKSVKALDANISAGFLFTNFQTINSCDKTINPSFLAAYESLYALPHKKIDQLTREIEPDALLRGLAVANFIGTSSVAIRRSILSQVGGFDEQLKNGDDYNLWVRLSLHYSAIFLDIPLHQYRIHWNSISKSNPAKRLENLIKLHKKHCTNEFPVDFIIQSRKKIGKYNFTISKIRLKNGERMKAFFNAKEAIKYKHKPISSFLLLAACSLPQIILTYFIQLRNQITKRT